MHCNTKRCSKCKVVKGVEEFDWLYKSRGRRQSHCKECRKRWRRENRDKISAANAEYNKKRREKTRAYNSEYYRKNRDRLKAQTARYQGENRDKANAWNAAYRRRNPGKSREHRAKRRALERAAAVGRIDYEAIIERDSMRCHLCGKKIRSHKDLHFDHIVPLSKGGEHSMRNIACAHATCNLKKGADDDFPVQLGMFDELSHHVVLE